MFKINMVYLLVLWQTYLSYGLYIIIYVFFLKEIFKFAYRFNVSQIGRKYLQWRIKWFLKFNSSSLLFDWNDDYYNKYTVKSQSSAKKKKKSHTFIHLAFFLYIHLVLFSKILLLIEHLVSFDVLKIKVGINILLFNRFLRVMFKSLCVHVMCLQRTYNAFADYLCYCQSSAVRLAMSVGRVHAWLMQLFQFHPIVARSLIVVYRPWLVTTTTTAITVIIIIQAPPLMRLLFINRTDDRRVSRLDTCARVYRTHYEQYGRVVSL